MFRDALIAELCINLGRMVTCLEFTTHKMKGGSGVEGYLLLDI